MVVGIYCNSLATDRLKTYRRPFAERENGLLCIQPYYDAAAGVRSKCRRRSG